MSTGAIAPFMFTLSRGGPRSRDPVNADDTPWPSLPSGHDEQPEPGPAARLEMLLPKPSALRLGIVTKWGLVLGSQGDLFRKFSEAYSLVAGERILVYAVIARVTSVFDAYYCQQANAESWIYMSLVPPWFLALFPLSGETTDAQNAEASSECTIGGRRLPST
jgi:hypothetical protein